MNNLPRRKVKELVSQYGQLAWENPSQLEGILRDTCANSQREISVLVGAAKEQIPSALLNVSGMPVQLLLEQLVQRLQDDLGFEKDAARWAVETWALALDVISTAQATSFTSESSSATQQRSTGDKTRAHSRHNDSMKTVKQVLVGSVWFIGIYFGSLITVLYLYASLDELAGLNQRQIDQRTYELTESLLWPLLGFSAWAATAGTACEKLPGTKR